MTRSVPVSVDTNDATSIEGALREVDAAIVLVSCGLAARVRLCNLPAAEEAAYDAAAKAQAAGIGFALLRDHPGSTTLIVGPRLEMELVRTAPAASDAPA